MQKLECPLCDWVKLWFGYDLEPQAERSWRDRQLRAHVLEKHVPELPSFQRRVGVTRPDSGEVQAASTGPAAIRRFPASNEDALAG